MHNTECCANLWRAGWWVLSSYSWSCLRDIAVIKILNTLMFIHNATIELRICPSKFKHRYIALIIDLEVRFIIMINQYTATAVHTQRDRYTWYTWFMLPCMLQFCIIHSMYIGLWYGKRCITLKKGAATPPTSTPIKHHHHQHHLYYHILNYGF